MKDLINTTNQIIELTAKAKELLGSNERMSFPDYQLMCQFHKKCLDMVNRLLVQQVVEKEIVQKVD